MEVIFMNGEIAQICDITIAAKSALKAKNTQGTITKEEIKMSANEIRQRIYALFAVFGVVIFFWLSFHVRICARASAPVMK